MVRAHWIFIFVALLFWGTGAFTAPPPAALQNQIEELTQPLNIEKVGYSCTDPVASSAGVISEVCEVVLLQNHNGAALLHLTFHCVVMGKGMITCHSIEACPVLEGK